MKFEFGLHSPVGVSCQDRTSNLYDLGITKKQKKLLRTLFKINSDTIHFSFQEKQELLKLDAYLDIPLVEAFFSEKPTYKSLIRLLSSKCTLIPNKFQNNMNIIKECCMDQSSTVELFQKVVSIVFPQIDLIKEYSDKPLEDYYDHSKYAKICNTVCTSGRLDILKLLRLPSRTCFIAAEFGHLQIIKYAEERGFPLNECHCMEAVMSGQLECLKYLINYVCFCLSDEVHHCNIREDICDLAAKNDHIHILQYLHFEKGFEWDEYVMTSAAGHGHIDCLRFLHENNCSWDEFTCVGAIEGGYVDCLQYAIENGCPYRDAELCAMAAEFGSSSCLQYLYKKGLKWDEKTCLRAIGHLDCLQFAHEHGCPWNRKEMLENRLWKYHEDCYNYILNHE